jgi:sulfatase maturation enzyme AslB (radical SAM superfamily)
MSDEVVLQSARRIAEHAGKHAFADVRIIRHGGEPLLDSATQLD